MCTFFHATKRTFNIGDSFSVDMFDGDFTVDHSNRNDKEKEVNEQLDEGRPEGVLSRTKCIYLFGNLSHCQHYAKSMRYEHIYEVHSDDVVNGPYPMVLVNTLYNSDPQIHDKIIQEYWNPTLEWKFNEFLASSFYVDREMPIPRLVLNIDFFTDQDLARNFIHLA